ncbi:sensor histidine kinase [Diaminobutyricibacter sp. McL0618]|uniref:sensor histidine kinase n=1 Tax=Leifsonia sp. McL0618 TaxID=3415677 RepID=UPI003CF30B7E
MDEVLLTASRLALLVTGVGGALAVVASATRRRVARGWIPAAAAIAILLLFAVESGGASSPVAQLLALITWAVGFPLLAATFPDGRFVPRWSLGLVFASVFVLIVDAVLGDRLRGSAGWWLFPVVQGLLAVGFIAYRYRRSATTSERESVRWVLLGLIMTLTLFLVVSIGAGAIGGGGALNEAVSNAAPIPLMLGLVIGLAWPRLWNVDAAFHVVLSVIFAVFALGGVFGAARWIATAADRPAVDAAVWGAVAVGVLAYPVVRAATRAATWLIYRDRITPDQAVARLALALDADEARPTAQRVTDTAAEATTSPAVLLTAASPVDEAVFTAKSGTPPEAAISPFPITFRGELLATLSAAPRLGESELSARDRKVMAAIAQHAAPALHGARALREATTTQAALVAAREEERRRLRRELHDDLGPALSGLALAAAALATRTEEIDDEIAQSARELQTDINDAATRSREISHGLRPPILDDHGLEAALRSRLGSATDVVFEVGHLGDLPAAVDLAALRIVQEAVTNVRRHADASLCRVAVERAANGLRIEVADNGVGMPQTATAGIGLRSIRERAAELGGRTRISRPRAGGTLVTVWLPIEATPDEETR